MMLKPRNDMEGGDAGHGFSAIWIGVGAREYEMKLRSKCPSCPNLAEPIDQNIFNILQL